MSKNCCFYPNDVTFLDVHKREMHDILFIHHNQTKEHETKQSKCGKGEKWNGHGTKTKRLHRRLIHLLHLYYRNFVNVKSK